VSPWSYSKIKKILRQETFDVIHLHEPLTPGITWPVLMQACALSHTVTIGTFHAYHERPNWLYMHSRPVFRKFFARLDSLIAVSRAARNFAYQMFPGDYRIIPNGVDLSRFGQSDKARANIHSVAADKKVTILFVGRLDKRKGFLNLFNAFTKIKPDYPHLQLKVVGPFEPEATQSYHNKAQAHHVTGIEFMGYIPSERLPTIYRNADIFCAPSIGFESFGIVLLEAMAAGLPIVASDIAGYRSVITDGQEGWLVPPNQPALLANALCQLVDNPPLRQAMGQRGQQKANQYSWDHIVDEILDVYLDTLKRKTKSKLFRYPKSGVHLPQRQANPEGKSC
jgi:phosphatidylinositol alpha-mannosyltransferase